MKYVWLLLLCMMPRCLQAQELEIISLKHRSVEEVIPIIQPLLDSDGVASGMNYQLILRTSANNMQQIKQLLQKLDVAARNLQVTVIQNVDSHIIEQMRALSGQLSNTQISFQARFAELQSQLNNHQNQSVRVLDGHRAWIAVGESVPVKQRQVIRNRHGVRVLESTQYQQASSGFYVQPRLLADKVVVELYTKNDSLSEQRTQHAQSTVSGVLGEWLLLADSEQSAQHAQDTLTSSQQYQKQQYHNILIKVEEPK